MDKRCPMTTEMILAYRAGRKTQTRRLRGLSNINENPDDWGIDEVVVDGSFFAFNENELDEPLELKPPYGVVGDRLLISEIHYIHATDQWGNKRVYYKADDPTLLERHSAFGRARWRPPMFMPKWAVRPDMRPLITGVRIERVEDISYPDLCAEGLDIYRPDVEPYIYGKLIGRWVSLWDSITSKYLWAGNLWVWAYEFERFPACPPEEG